MTEADRPLFESGPFDVDGGRSVVIQFVWWSEPRTDDLLAGTAEPIAVLIIDAVGTRRQAFAARHADAFARLTATPGGPDQALREAIGVASWRSDAGVVTVRAVRVEGGSLAPIAPALTVDIAG